MSGERKIRVYLVDYDRTLLDRVASAAMANPEQGIRVVGTASSYKQCMDEIVQPRIAREGVDVFVISVYLPGRSGLELARAVRELYRDARVIMLVDDTTRHLVDQVTRVADEYLVKPFYVSRLFALVRSVHARPDDRDPGLAIEFEPPALQQETKEPVLYSEDELPPPLSESIVAVVYSAKGGDGKSTVACNVAALLARLSSKKICIVDLDLSYPCVATDLDLQVERSIVDLVPYLDNHALTAEVLRQSLATHLPTGLSALPGPLRPEEGRKITGDHVRLLLAYLKQMFDVIVVDCGVDVSDPVLVAMLEADRILLVVTPTISSLQKNASYLKLAERIRLPVQKFSCVLNRYTPSAPVTPAAVEQVLKLPVRARIPDMPDVLSEAQARGDLVALSDNPKVRDPWVDVAMLVYPYFKRPKDYGERRHEGWLPRILGAVRRRS